MINVIGMHGKKRRGKDTVAKMIGEMLGGTTKIVSPADNLKLLICEALGLEYSDLGGALALMDACKDHWTIKVDMPDADDWWTLSGRQLQEQMGNGARKVFGDDFWLDQIMPPTTQYVGEDMGRLAALHDLDPVGHDTLINASVRYENEAQRIFGYGGVVIEVVRPGMPDDGSTAPTEQRLPEELIDYTIVNDKGLDELRDSTLKALIELDLL